MSIDVSYIKTMLVDVSFASNHFPKYKLGLDNEILDKVKEDFKGRSHKEVVVEEMNQLSSQEAFSSRPGE